MFYCKKNRHAHESLYLCFVLPISPMVPLSLHVCELQFQVGHLPHETQLLALQ